MKKLFLSSLLICIGQICFGQNQLSKNESVKQIEVITNNISVPNILLTHAWVGWGRKKKQCQGNGICVIIVDDGPHCVFGKIIENTENMERDKSDVWVDLKDDKLNMYFFNKKEKFKELILDEVLKVEGDLSKRFRTKNITIKSGNYKVDYLKEGIGIVSFDITKEKINLRQSKTTKIIEEIKD